MTEGGGQQRVRNLLDAALQDPFVLTTLPAADVDFCLRIARRVRLLGRFAAAFETEGRMHELPCVVRDQLVSAKMMADARVRLAHWELDRIAWAMRNAAETPLVLMKGCAYLALGLPNAGGRLFADVDLLTTREELEHVESVLNAHNWETTKLSPYDQNYYRVWTHELPPLTHRERDVEIDLHHNILPQTARLNPDSQKLLERIRMLENSRYYVLSKPDLLLHTMTHLMFDADLADQLRDLVDIQDIAEHFAGNDAEFWPRFMRRAVEMDLARPAYYALRYAHRLLGAEIPESVLEASAGWAPPAPIVWLMDAMVPRALFPQHPDVPSKVSALCRLLLYVRSHWIRMPPWLLVYHLSYKFVVTRFGRKRVQQ